MNNVSLDAMRPLIFRRIYPDLSCCDLLWLHVAWWIHGSGDFSIIAEAVGRKRKYLRHVPVLCSADGKLLRSRDFASWPLIPNSHLGEFHGDFLPLSLTSNHHGATPSAPAANVLSVLWQ